MKRAKVNRPDATGRDSKRLGSDGAVIILRRSFWLSPQVSALSVTARALLVELTAIYWGPASNGKLYLSVRDGAARLGLSDHKAVSSAFDELIDLGLLKVTIASHFAVKAGCRSRARGFYLNWKADNGRPAGDSSLAELDFQRLDKRQKKRVERRSIALAAHRKAFSAVEESSPLTALRGDLASESVAESTTLTLKNGGNALASAVEENTTHISYYQGGRGPTPSDIMQGIRGEAWTPPFVRSPTPGQPLFCGLIALRRSIYQTSKKMAPASSPKIATATPLRPPTKPTAHVSQGAAA